MSATLRPSPQALKDLLTAAGWVVSYEDSYNWLLTKEDLLPLAVPKRLRTVPYEILCHCLIVAGIGDRPIHRDVDAAGG